MGVFILENKNFFKLFLLIFINFLFEGCKNKEEAKGPPYLAKVQEKI